MTETKDVSLLYEKEFDCPICLSPFKSTKVRNSKLKIERQEEDLNIVYKELTPSFYQVIVCPVCGYSATEAKFNTLKPAQKVQIGKTLLGKWNGRDYTGERSIDDAILTWMLAIGIAETAHFGELETGMYTLTLARLYRLKGDVDAEKRFTKSAVDKFIKAYSIGDYSSYSDMHEGKLSYLIAELSRRIGDKKNASVYMGIALKDPLVKGDVLLSRLAQDQWLMIKDMK